MSKEKHIECGCHDPAHFLHLWFDKEWQSFEVSFRVHHGSLWKRIIKAVEIIFDGWESSYSNWVNLGPESVRQVRDFCDECLADFGTEEPKP
jgi:hypothetical protein